MRRLALLLLATSLATPAFANSTLPTRKPGYWVTSMVMHMNMPGTPADTDNTPKITAMCTDPATDLKVMTSSGGADCTAPNVQGSNPSYTITMSCKDPMGGTTPMVTTSTMTFTSDTQMHMVSKTTSAHITGDMQADSKWQGACPAGWVPGDVGRMDNGVITKFANVLTPPKPPGG